MNWPWRNKNRVQERGLFGSMVSSSLCQPVKPTCVTARPQILRLNSTGEVTSDEDWSPTPTSHTIQDTMGIPDQDHIHNKMLNHQHAKMWNQESDSIFSAFGNQMNYSGLNGGGGHNHQVKRNLTGEHKMPFGSVGANFGPLRYPQNHQQVFSPKYNQRQNIVNKTSQNGLLPFPPPPHSSYMGVQPPFWSYMPHQINNPQPFFGAAYTQFSSNNFPTMDYQNYPHMDYYHHPQMNYHPNMNNQGAGYYTARNGGFHCRNNRRQHNNHRSPKHRKCPSDSMSHKSSGSPGGGTPDHAVPKDDITDLSAGLTHMHISSDSCEPGSQPKQELGVSGPRSATLDTSHPRQPQEECTSHPHQPHEAGIVPSTLTIDTASRIESCQSTVTLNNGSHMVMNDSCRQETSQVNNRDTIQDTSCDNADVTDKVCVDMDSEDMNCDSYEQESSVSDSKTPSASSQNCDNKDIQNDHTPPRKSDTQHHIIKFTAAITPPSKTQPHTQVDIRSLSQQRKKKSRPSAKKRRRQKQQRQAEPNQPCPTNISVTLNFENQSATKKHKSGHQQNSASQSASPPPTGSEKSPRRHSTSSFSISIFGCEALSDDDTPAADPAGADVPQINAKIAFFISPSDSDADSDWDEVSDQEDTDMSVEWGFVSGLTSDLMGGLTSDLLSPLTCLSAPPQRHLLEKCASEPVFPSSQIQAANQRWRRLYDGLPNKHQPQEASDARRVSFAAEPKLTSVHSVEEWERKGPWEQYALDRWRFKDHIAEVEAAIGHVFDKQHRQAVYHRLYAS